MTIIIYILGFLKRYGEQHGYILKQNISNNVSDFANIKMPTVYYHLEKLKKKGFIQGESSRDGNRPEKMVYKITKVGNDELKRLLHDALNTKYCQEYVMDTIFFFWDNMNRKEVLKILNKKITDLEKIVKNLHSHKNNAFSHLKDSHKKYAGILFSHHQHHFLAEIKWLKETINVLVLE